MFTTSTVQTIVTDLLTSVSDILTVNLPTIFGFLLAIAGTFLFWRWVRGAIRRPR